MDQICCYGKGHWDDDGYQLSNQLYCELDKNCAEHNIKLVDNNIKFCEVSMYFNKYKTA